jgi:23S rRNA (pseudouridine1915-N3)-methyltransferase
MGTNTSYPSSWAEAGAMPRINAQRAAENIVTNFPIPGTMLANIAPATYICKLFATGRNREAVLKMGITLLTVGKTDVRWVMDGLDLYVSRLKHYVQFTLNEIPQLKNVSALTQEQIRQREGELILRSLKSSDEVILLDERGREYRSVEFASMLEDKMSRSGRNIVFVIGGAYGFSDAVYKRSDAMLSISRMTFSHQMVRTIFVEQLYRAFTILKGEPYHHE